MIGLRMVMGTLFGAALLARVYSLAVVHPPAPETDSLDREQLVAQLAAGNLPAQPFCFNADVKVLLGVGRDGLPGRANADDNLNGVMDDRGEIGAVGSDDLCLSPADAGYETLAQDESSFVISRGGYVPCGDPTAIDPTAIEPMAIEPMVASRYLTESLGWLVMDH